MSAVPSSAGAGQKTVLAACPHDCPDTCSMLVTVENDRVVKVRGNPDHPFTDGRLCVKVNHYEERIHHPDRVLYPLKRSGPKGSGQFTRITWQAAMEEIASRWKQIIKEHGPTAILPYSYLGTEGILNGLNVGDAFFNKLGATITERTFCDSGACTGYMMTVGPTPGTDPESFVHSRYIILWACNTISTNLHHWPFIAEAQKRGAKIVVIDPVKTRTARQADWHIPIKPGTDGALAMAMINVIIGEGLIDKDYVEKYTVGYDELAERAQAYTPEKVASITGIAAEDIRKLAREYATTRPSVIRIGVAVERHSGGGQTVRALTCLPALVGAWRDVGGGILQLPIWAFPVKWDALMRPDWIKPGTRVLNQWKLGAALTGELKLDPPDPVAVRLQRQPDGGGTRAGEDRQGPGARRSVHGGERAFHHRHRPLRRHRAARHHADGAARDHVLLGALLSVAEPAGDLAARGGGAQHRAVPAPGRGHGLRRSAFQAQRRADGGGVARLVEPRAGRHHHGGAPAQRLRAAEGRHARHLRTACGRQFPDAVGQGRAEGVDGGRRQLRAAAVSPGLERIPGRHPGGSAADFHSAAGVGRHQPGAGREVSAEHSDAQEPRLPQLGLRQHRAPARPRRRAVRDDPSDATRGPAASPRASAWRCSTTAAASRPRRR